MTDRVLISLEQDERRIVVIALEELLDNTADDDADYPAIKHLLDMLKP